MAELSSGQTDVFFHSTVDFLDETKTPTPKLRASTNVVKILRKFAFVSGFSQRPFVAFGVQTREENTRLDDAIVLKFDQTFLQTSDFLLKGVDVFLLVED